MPLDLSAQQVTSVLKTLSALADIDGHRSPHEHQLLEVIASALDHRSPLPAPGSGAQPPDDLAAQLPDAEHRTLLVQGLIVMAMMDAEVLDAEVAYVQLVARALGVREPRIRFLKLYAQGRVNWIRGELPMRSEMIQGKFKEAWERGGLMEVFQLATFTTGWSECTRLQEKYEELATYPESSFGRAYYEHMTAKGFGFPGYRKSFPEVLVVHDLSHILAGIDTDASGECEVIAFIAGYIKADPFWYIFMILMHMHLDVEVFFGDPTARLAGDPRRMAAAFFRGLQVNTDLYDHWDFWVDFPLPLEEVRAKYNIPPNTLTHSEATRGSTIQPIM